MPLRVRAGRLRQLDWTEAGQSGQIRISWPKTRSTRPRGARGGLVTRR